MSISSVEKCPTSYDEYNFTLADLYRKTALEELRESDEIRDQALRQIRGWIAKNPTIQRCRTDGPFLLRFLRARKFNHVAACENLERYLALRQTVASWFQKLDTNEAWVEEIVDDWPILPLGYDDRGRLVILIKMGNFNVERFGNVDQIRLMMMILESYYDEEKIQIAGCVFVFEDTGLTMSHVAQWSLTDIKRFIDCVNHTIPLRIKEVHVVNLPRYAVAVGEMCLGFASTKLKERIHCHRSMDSLTKVVAQSLLPKEYDGEVPINEFKKQLRERLKLQRDRILALDQMVVDQSRFASLWKDSHAVGDGQDDSFGVVGSFRKLNVD
ncbi:clavesin-2-like [Ochlerotatus camptorhynchus]|uniref:clavesin-2-like n=1 Tax=Ochlerotatus camptorhynchus TaxID=644619 RepID=UPI0031DB289A